MKALRPISLVVLLAMVLVLAPAASAAGPAGSWVSGITCQNLSTTSTAVINIEFYPQDNGTAALSYTDPTPIPIGGSRGYFTPSTPPGVPSGFVGAAVVSSDQPLACTVNTQTNSAGLGTTTNPYRIGTSGGVDTTAAGATNYVPQVMKTLAGTWSSYIAVQNTEAAATAVTVTYKDRNGNNVPAATESLSIPAQSNHIFYQADNANLPGNFLGSAIVSANNGTSKLAVVVNMYNAGTDNTSAQLFSYNAFTSGGNKLYVPRFMRNYYGYNGGLTIQNVGNAATTVQITFHFGSNNYTYNSPSIAQGTALALYAPNVAELAPVDALGVGSRYGSAEIQAAAGGNIVAIVNEDNRGGAGVPAERISQGATYNAMIDGSQTNTVFFPQVPRKAGGIFSGGFQVANTTGTATTCNIIYGANVASEANVPLPANGVISKYMPNVTASGLTNGFNSSVSVTCGQAVIGISNMSVEPGSGKLGDSFSETGGINR
jgi:hypothetical protein